ncbi:hypothetical protein BpHYR1_032121, partial [Brachionus plicatilis]
NHPRSSTPFNRSLEFEEIDENEIRPIEDPRLRAKIEELLYALEVKEEECISLNDKIEDMKDNHQKSILLRSEEFEALKLSCDKRVKYFEELIRFNEIGEEKLNLKIKELQDRLSQKEKITAENLSLNDRFKDFECQIEKLTIENSKLKVENRKRTCQYKKCKNYGNVNKNGTESSESFYEIDQLIEYEIENTKLKTKLHESERTANQKTEIEKEYHQSTIKNYKDEIYHLEKEILRINMELNEKFDEIRNSKDMIIEMQNKIENLNKYENEKKFDEERTLKTDKNFELAIKNEEIFKLEEKINSLYTDIENSDILRKEKEATFNQLKNDYDALETKCQSIESTLEDNKRLLSNIKIQNETDKNFELAIKNEEIFKLEEKINSLYTDIENSDILRKRKTRNFDFKKRTIELKKSFNIPENIHSNGIKILQLDNSILCPYKICGGIWNSIVGRKKHFSGANCPLNPKNSENLRKINESKYKKIVDLENRIAEYTKLVNQMIEEKDTQQSSVKMRAQANIYTSNSDESDNDIESKIGNDSIMSDYYESDLNPVCAPKTSKKRVAFADSKIYSKFSKRKLESLTSTSDSESDEKSKKSPRIKQNVSNNSFNGDGPHVGRYNIHGGLFGQKVFEGPRKGLFYRHPKSFNKVYVTDSADHCVKFKK